MRCVLLSLAMLFLSGVTTSSAKACDNSPDLARIPGASEADAERRYLAYEKDLGVIARLESEKAALEESWTVYLATIARVEKGEEGKPPKSISVTPVWQVRSPLPMGQQTIALSSDYQGCRSRGYLHLSTEIGGLVVVFEGPGSRYGIDAEVARSGELIDAITMYALKVDPGQFK